MGVGLLFVLKLCDFRFNLINVVIVLVHSLQKIPLLLLDGFKLCVDIADAFQQLALFGLCLLILSDFSVHSFLISQLTTGNFAALLDLSSLVLELLLLFSDLVYLIVDLLHLCVEILL